MDNQGVFVEWLDDGAIVVFRAETDDDAINSWADFIMTIAAGPMTSHLYTTSPALHRR